jgi:hypothetical protein
VQSWFDSLGQRAPVLGDGGGDFGALFVTNGMPLAVLLNEAGQMASAPAAGAAIFAPMQDAGT